MKNYTFLLFILICLTIMSCSTASKRSGHSNLQNQKELICENLVWYVYINGKPDMSYLENSKKVAERWGFKIVHELGNCTNTEEERQKDALSKEKSRAIFECLSNTLGGNWKDTFWEEVKAENKK